MEQKMVVVIAGLPMSGKSTLGRALSKETGFHFVDIDEGPASCAPPQDPNPLRSDKSQILERARMTVAYTVLHAAVESNLSQGFSLIVAANYSRHTSQDFLRVAAQSGNGQIKVVLCRYNDTEEEIERRIKDRLTRKAIGGCRSVEHYINDRSRYEGINLPHIEVTMDDGEEGITAAVQQSINYIYS